MSSAVGAGLLNSKSVPAPVLGNAITSRIDSDLHKIAMSRSNPVIVGDIVLDAGSKQYVPRAIPP